MKLKLISIKHWRKINKIDIHFNKLMLFLGQSIEGTNNVTSAISFAFNKTPIDKDDISKNCDYSQIKLIFIKDKKSYKLKIFINKDLSIKYFLKTNSDWKEISYSEYVDFIEQTPFIHIHGKKGGDFKEVASFFYNLLIKNPEKSKEIEKDLDNLYQEINLGHKNSEIYRYLFFQFIKKIALESLNKNRTLLGDATILFEEPELYLNPQKQRELYNYFIKLSNRGVNIYLKTFSSCFVGLKQYKSICITKQENEKISVLQTNKEIFQDDEIKSFNMNYWINPDRAELFFAKKVILVEGQTDKIVIPFLGKLLKVFRYDYSVIECGSKSTIPQFMVLLNNFKIPYVAVYDKDNHSWRTEEEIENSNKKNKQINSLAKENLGKAIPFENDIEEEIYNAHGERGSYKNKPFNALKYISEPGFTISKRLTKKIKDIYE
ncbi:TOPRIM nucleotidyl transferase/hydrolase domain-containing protein [Fusobacterium sp.]|uniref:ATP-dependent nuclease n=1 Tax=Fusobacterium sp. TaxID=68766 RepID=UPI002613BBA3|nr:TOPRIM nucleotidyl transferase/hydrolase domain-containing protein [Fusobacterium sp.]